MSAPENSLATPMPPAHVEEDGGRNSPQGIENTFKKRKNFGESVPQGAIHMKLAYGMPHNSW